MKFELKNPNIEIVDYRLIYLIALAHMPYTLLVHVVTSFISVRTQKTLETINNFSSRSEHHYPFFYRMTLGVLEILNRFDHLQKSTRTLNNSFLHLTLFNFAWILILPPYLQFRRSPLFQPCDVSAFASHPRRCHLQFSIRTLIG